MQTIERSLPLFPLERVVLFPGMALPLHIFEERYKLMIGTCQVTDRLFGVLLLKSGREVGRAQAEPMLVGCTARILEIQRLPEGRMNILAVGESRFRLSEPPSRSPDGYFLGQASIMTTEDVGGDVPSALVESVEKRCREYLDLLGKVGGREPAIELKVAPGDALSLSFLVGGLLRVSADERQGLLEQDDVSQRLRMERTLLRREVQTLRLMVAAKGANKSIGPFSAN